MNLKTIALIFVMSIPLITEWPGDLSMGLFGCQMKVVGCLQAKEFMCYCFVPTELNCLFTCKMVM